MPLKVAVVGATGNVGREMLSVLKERQFPATEVVALASTRSTGVDVSFGDGTLKVHALEHYDFKGTDIVLRPRSPRTCPLSSTIRRPGGWIATCRWWFRK